MTEFLPYDPAEDLETVEAIAAFLSDAMETRDSAYIANAFGVAARAKGMTQLARETGVSRQHLYDSLSDSGNPTLKTLLAITSALGLDIKTVPNHEPG